MAEKGTKATRAKPAATPPAEATRAAPEKPKSKAPPGGKGGKAKG